MYRHNNYYMRGDSSRLPEIIHARAAVCTH